MFVNFFDCLHHTSWLIFDSVIDLATSLWKTEKVKKSISIKVRFQNGIEQIVFISPWIKSDFGSFPFDNFDIGMQATSH